MRSCFECHVVQQHHTLIAPRLQKRLLRVDRKARQLDIQFLLHAAGKLIRINRADGSWLRVIAEENAMIGITLTDEQIRNAPAPVRQWIEQQVIASLGVTATGCDLAPDASSPLCIM